jgi:hypothetical protein
MPDLFTSGYGPPRSYQQDSWNNSPFNLYPPPALPPVASGAGGTPPATTIPTDPTLNTPYGTGPLSPAIADLIKPGLVPDIARQSAELTAGRGIAGSPAAASTAVKMSEEDYLKRLGLANQLMTGEAGRALPYQITPFQSATLANLLAVAGMKNFPWGGNIGGNPYGSRSGSGYSGGNFGGGGGSGVNPSVYPFANLSGLGGVGNPGGDGAGGGGSPSLDDMLRELGISGEDTPEDFTSAPLPEDPQYYM